MKMNRQTSGKWGVDLGYMGRGKIKSFPSRDALEDWLVAGYDSCEGSEKARYEDMLAQLDDGINIVNYDNIDNSGIVNEDSPSEDYDRFMSGEEVDVKNLWKPTGDAWQDKVNIAKSWLVGASQGQTWPLDELLDIDVDRLWEIGYDYDFGGIEQQFDDIVGYKHDYDIDDPELDEKAQAIVAGLEDLSNDAMKNPEQYFEEL
jgi:hypothetical protein